MIGLENRPENHDGSGDQLLDDLERLRRLAGEWGLGLTSTWRTRPVVAWTWWRQSSLSPRLVNVHLSDAGERSVSGRHPQWLRFGPSATRNWEPSLAEVMTALQRAGYDGLVTLEPSPASLRAWWPLAPRPAVRDAVADMRSLVSGAPASTRTHAEPRFPAR